MEERQTGEVVRDQGRARGRDMAGWGNMDKRDRWGEHRMSHREVNMGTEEGTKT